MKGWKMASTYKPISSAAAATATVFGSVRTVAGVFRLGALVGEQLVSALATA